jgi:putative sigma-54 modulation protein
MELELRHKGIAVGPSLRDLVASHIQSALGRFAHRIRGVTVQLMDTNGQRGGIDKYCGIAVRLSGGKTIRAREVNTQAVAAFYFAVDRAACAVGRELERRLKRARRRRPWNLEAG